MYKYIKLNQTFIYFYSIKMKIRYDENFAEKFGADAVNTIRRIVAQVKNNFAHLLYLKDK